MADGVLFVYLFACLLLCVWGGGGGGAGRERGKRGVPRLCVCGLRVCACVDAGRGERDRVRYAFVN